MAPFAVMLDRETPSSVPVILNPLNLTSSAVIVTPDESVKPEAFRTGYLMPFKGSELINGQNLMVFSQDRP